MCILLRETLVIDKKKKTHPGEQCLDSKFFFMFLFVDHSCELIFKDRKAIQIMGVFKFLMIKTTFIRFYQYNDNFYVMLIEKMMKKNNIKHT